MGWSISKISPETDPFSAELVDYGTIVGKGKKTKIIVGIINQVDEIINKYGVDILCCEDFLFNPGRRLKGLFVVPSLIGVLKYHWYLRTSNEAIIVSAPTWKAKICGNPRADKDAIRSSMTKYLKEETISDIEAYYKAQSGRGEQDCIDSLALNMYVCSMISRNRNADALDLM